ncbi:hypothetical protein DRE_02735 [Drechslerella stenobrocha 248]|uniref:PHD-type domain-containing protein n=1 Tax=Drechslerella stenobrocha 248 TaxID=1043628 RepID=W7I6K6_9PEZI|nr:hypothetical protein DRE_02735 [Drechslerella stenobrocha 248]
MTDSSLWSHLLCAIWIPEVTISNMVYMEPVEGIDLVPKSRWKLHCYICKQRMGACIQCSNKNCYLAFHVTCARKAKLYLSMRQVPADPSGATAVGAERNLIFDGSQLKAFCDKHVPTEWRKEYRTDIAIRNVQDYYENTFYDKEWGDSQTKALSGTHFAHNSGTSNVQKLTLTLGGKRKRPSAGVGSKTIWRLPSGAPVIPQILYNTVIEAISRFSVRKPKEYVAEICKYWTLKREARRDASLLKRLQVSASSNFTSDEVTKKDYSATFDGEEKLKRRLDFAIKLRHDLERIRLLADDIKKREKEKLRQAECLKEMIDAVYFPVTPILTQILERAQQLDSKDFFKVEFGQIKQKLHDRQYTTVYQFSRDILSTLTASVTSRSKFAATAILEGSEYIDDPIRGLWSAAATPAASNIANPLENIPSAVVPATSSAPLKVNKALGDTAGKTAGRILRVIQPMLENAKLQEIAMREDPNERMAGRVDERYQEILLERKKREEEFQAQFAAANEASRVGHITDDTAGDKMDIDNPATTEAEVNDRAVEVTIESMTASLSQSQQKDDEPDRIMGIPWYTKPFSPMGATLLSEERWMGMDVIRDMSPLSELDEDAIERLQRSETPDLFDSVEGDDGDFDGGNMSTAGSDESPSAKDKATSNMSSTATSNWAAAGTRVSLRATKGSKRVSYIEPEQHLQQMQAAETPRPKSSSRTGTREVDLEQVVVIGSTRSQTKQAINKAQRRGRGYVWVEVEEEKQGRRHRSRGDGLTEVDVDTTVAKDIDAMDIDSDLITGVETHFVDRGDEATNIVDDLPGSIDSPLTSVPDDPLDPGDRLSLHSDEMEALDQELDFGSNGAYRGEPEGVQSHPGSNSDNMETEHTDTEFHTPGEISNEERGTETMARELTDESAVEETPATATAAVVQETESQFHIEDSRSPSKRNARSSPRQRDGNSGVGAEDMMLPNARSPQRESIESGAMQSTPKKSPPAVSKGLESSPFSPVPMTTRSRRVLEVEATPSRRGSSRSRVAKKR